MKRITLLLALVAAVLASSCRAHRVIHRRSHAVVVNGDHLHTARCGHFRHRGRWYLHAGHRHQGGCGHAFVKGVWIVQD